MDYRKQYSYFIHSHYFSDGIRITVGIALPSIIAAGFHHLSTGLVLSLGALCMSIADIPGPIHHRRNGLLVCAVLVTCSALVTGLAAPYAWLTALVLVSLCFGFGMLNVYGNRAANIGMASLLAMVLSLEAVRPVHQVFMVALLLLSGSLWYLLFSLSLYQIRPYQLARQALAECLLATADYLEIRSAFYGSDTDPEENYRLLVRHQVLLHEKQDLVRELLFKSRLMVRDATTTGRSLTLLFTESVDLTEYTMASSGDYTRLRTRYRGTGILEECRAVSARLVKGVQSIAFALSGPLKKIAGEDEPVPIEKLQDKIRHLKPTSSDPAALPAYQDLESIGENLRIITAYLGMLRRYAFPDPKAVASFPQGIDPRAFISRQDYSAGRLFSNLRFRSSIFRHALRLSLATGAGFGISLLLPLGHAYWILLTVVVILKPAYSLTLKRNYARILGTLAGGLIGIGLIWLVREQDLLLILMLVFMLITYSFSRVNYLISVLAMTPYVLLLFNILDPGNMHVLRDRFIDTFIGSAIAAVASHLFLPEWEALNIPRHLIVLVASIRQYFESAAWPLAGKPVSQQDYKLARRNLYLSSSNFNGAFQRMQSEPRSRQGPVALIQQLSVTAYQVSSHIAILGVFTRKAGPQKEAPSTGPAIQQITELLIRTEELMHLPANTSKNSILEKTPAVWNSVELEKQARVKGPQALWYTDQLIAIYQIALSLEKLCAKLVSA